MYNFYTGLASVANWTVPSPVTICYWLILRGYNGGGTNRLFGSGDNFETIFLTGTTKFRGDLFANSGTESTGSGAVGTRIHLAFTASSSTEIDTYLNGSLDNSDPDTPSSPTSPATLGVGGRAGTTDVANGDMEDVRVYNRALSAQEIQTIYVSNGLDLNYNGLINRWGVVSKGNGTDIGTDYIYDLTGSRQHLQKVSNNIYYRGGFIVPRRRV